MPFKTLKSSSLMTCKCFTSSFIFFYSYCYYVLKTMEIVGKLDGNIFFNAVYDDCYTFPKRMRMCLAYHYQQHIILQLNIFFSIILYFKGIQERRLFIPKGKTFRKKFFFVWKEFIILLSFMSYHIPYML